MNGKSKYETYQEFRKARSAHKAAHRSETLELKAQKSEKGRGKKSARPKFDPRYASLTPEQLPATESLKITLERVLPFWHSTLAPAIKSGKHVIIGAHGNSIRAMVKYLDNISENEITELNIPTGLPLVYELDENLKPIKSYYLGDPEEAAKKAAAVANQGKAK